MGIEGKSNLSPRRPERPEDPSIPYVHFPEEEIQKMRDEGMSEKEIVDKWVEAINKVAQARLEEEKAQEKKKRSEAA